MEFEPPLQPGRLIQRYKRFLADVQLENGQTVTAHCPNSGSMATCKESGQPVLLQPALTVRRKLPFTWELFHSGRSWVGINTHRANALVTEAIEEGRIPELTGYEQTRREVQYGQRSRIDLLLEDSRHLPCYVEVKNCTLLAPDGWVRFPDAITERGRKHLEELAAVAKEGSRAVMLFLVNRADGQGFGPADHIDSVYGRRLREVTEQGVELLAYRTRITPEAITVEGPEPIGLGYADELA